MRDQLVTETIDARILRLVGLEQAFDLDYETYLILLKEAQVKGKNTLAPEEQAILANERKRVRGKVGRFKPKTKTIRVDNITSVGKVSQKILPGTKGIGSALIVKSLENISKTVESISDNLSDQSKEDKKEAEENRKDEENKKRRKKEESLETSAKKIVSAAKKLFAPVKGILDSIYNYLFYTFLGRGVNEALTWLANPENKNKIAALGKFVSDFWPALLGTAVAFFTPLGNFIRTTLAEIAKLGLRFPLVSIAALGYIARQNEIRKIKPYVEKDLKSSEETLKSKEAPWYQKLGAYFAKEQLTKPGGPKDPLTMPVPGAMYASGGVIDQNTGLKISGAGPDTQLTALQPGEVVMNRATVRAVGAGNLLNLNRMFGGPNANKPRFANNIQFAKNGGLVGGFMDWWNRGRNVRVQNENTARFGGLRQYFKKMPDPSTLFGDDALQITRSNKAFQSGATGYRGWNPFKAFTPQMVKTGPTPAIRQAIERPLRAAAPILRRAMPIANSAAGIQLGMQLHNYMQTRNTTIRAQQYGYGTVEDMMTAPERYAKLSRSAPPTPTLLPSPKNKTNIITLPPSIENISSPTPRAGGSDIPSFSAIAPGNRRMENAQIYGIVP
jgi:hypothetical protein